MDPEELQAHTEKLQAAARAAYDLRVPFRNIQTEHHRRVLDRATKNVLCTELAQFTYAQIIDGLPTGDVSWDRRYCGVFGEHPIDLEHEELCPGAMEKAREFHEEWNSEILMFDPKAIAAYLQAKSGSKAFNMRLLELVAVTLHQIGVLLFQLEFRMHQGDIDATTDWRMPPVEGLVEVPPRPTLFSHHAYLDADVYPEGVADIVGYWAEDRILGGVTVFDRRAEESGTTPNVYFNSCRRRQTHRVYQLRDDQQEALFSFLLSDTDSHPPEPNPLPILSDAQNRVRVDSEVAITHHGIYRDVWERKPITKDELRVLERRPKSDIDYPEYADEVFRINKQLGIPLPQLRERSPSV
ncbi:hypothetical protein NM208_g2550 [Fusarium decemcellulare]|uniref:Uncharacterized protein n=2 Tax=Fusarium decemcellulare TaxID=57161 RepID=A0ACC1SSG0_9HYPO|nr:hypothetical protein NM208_g5707 [Fusarium decemcellulare]KAJ3545347.1 hypothetical protein NM208_g2550 [Fusarium decemcellulare]